MKRFYPLVSALCMLSALLLTACDLSVRPTPHPVSVTPTVVPTAAGDLPSSPSPRPDMRPCLAEDLDAVAGYQAMDASMVGAVRFTSTSTTSCALESELGIHILDSEGKLMPVANLDSEDGPSGDVRQVLRPGEVSYVSFVWRNWCGAAQGPYTLAVALPGEGGQLNVPALDLQGNPLSDTPPCAQIDATSTISVGPFEKQR